MQDQSINHLRAELKRRYSTRLRPYGSSPEEEHGLGFVIEGIPAVFSAITLDGTLEENRFDVQIESCPPGDYIFTGQVELAELLELIDVFTRPRSEWP